MFRFKNTPKPAVRANFKALSAAAGREFGDLGSARWNAIEATYGKVWVAGDQANERTTPTAMHLIGNRC